VEPAGDRRLHFASRARLRQQAEKHEITQNPRLFNGLMAVLHLRRASLILALASDIAVPDIDDLPSRGRFLPVPCATFRQTCDA